MPPIDPNSVNGVIYQTRLRWTLHNQECFNVFHFRSNGSQPIVAQLLQVLLACAVDNLLPVLGADVRLNGADVKSINGGAPLEAEYTFPDDNDGEIVGGTMPGTVAVVVGIRTLHPGRSGRGRFFLPGISESHHDEGRYDAAFETALVAFLDCLATAFFVGDPPAANQFCMGVWSKKDTAFYDAYSFKRQNILGTMRSRKIGNGS